MLKAVDFFKCLSDETRLRCVSLLLNRRELCVCELTHALGLSQPKISRHLALLRTQGLLQDRRRGTWIYYRLHPDLPAWAHAVLQQLSADSEASLRFSEDEKRLRSMPNRPPAMGCCADEAGAAPDHLFSHQPEENPA